MTDDTRPVYRAWTTLMSAAVRGDARRMAAAALEVAGAATALPEGFGGDVRADAGWLADALGALPSPWAAIDAMTLASGVPHTALVSAALRPRMMAVIGGAPPVTPGWLLQGGQDGRFVVSDVVRGGSAERAGLALGDVVLAIDGAPVGLPMRTLGRLAARAEGDVVVLDVDRGGTALRLSVPLVAAPPHAVESRVGAAHVGLLRLRSMTASDDATRDAAALARVHVRELEDAGATSLILDLRSSPGGTSRATLRVAALFCDADPIVAYRTGEQTKKLPREGTGAPFGGAMAVLVDDQTASASEELALALQAHRRAVVVGTATLGALHDTGVTPLADGYGLMTPLGVGVSPVTFEPVPRVVPDVEVAARTPEELAAGRDRPLEAAIAALRG
jgi:C-terminal processing protease CtpA/Prc